MKKSIILLFVLGCETYFPQENDSAWLDLVDPHSVEDDSKDCLHCSELRRPEDYSKACTAAKQIVNALAKCQCMTSEQCPSDCGWLDSLDPECAQNIDWYACEHFWTVCENDKPKEKYEVPN